MRSVDSITDPNDLIIEIEVKLAQYKLNKSLLIREVFILWFVLVEGIQCRNFTEGEIATLLRKDFNIYQTHYSDDDDFRFIFGWIINVAFWYLDSNLDEEYGSELLDKAYRSDSENKLFRWANRKNLKLSETELKDIGTEIHLRFDEWYEFGPLIKKYFLQIISY